MARSSALQNAIIKPYGLVLLALATAMFPRVFTAMGAPAVFNFLHFAFVPAIFVLLCSESQPRLLKPLVGISALLGVIAVSALINGAGFINALLDFLLLVEPFLLLLAIVNVQWSYSSIGKFRLWLLLFAIVHVAFAFFQRFALGLTADDVKGVFLEMGAGHHVAGAVALSAAVYFWVHSPLQSMWLRAIFATSSAAVVVLSDSKQVIAVFLVSLAVLVLTKWKQIGTVFRYLVILIAAAGITVLMAITVFSQLTNWADLDKIRAGLEQKLSVFPRIASFYDSGLNWLFGLGPGHTVGRLGWLLPDYFEYLRPLGATTSPVTQAVWGAQQADWLSNEHTGSSMWSLLFSWSGVWGDLGLIGLGTYLGLWYLVWSRFCSDDLSKFFLINILAFGFIFSWMEEPAYMLFVITLIALQWQHQNTNKKTYQKPSVKRSFLKPHDTVGHSRLGNLPSRL